MLCDCPRDALCPTCLVADYERFYGVAARRGEHRQADVAAMRPKADDREMLLAICAAWMADVTADRRLRERLAPVVLWFAAPQLREGRERPR